MMHLKTKRWLWLLSLCLAAAALTGCGRQPSRESNGNVPTTASGSELFEQLDCVHCHQMSGNGPGPSLAGLYGDTIPLESGERVTMDEQYIRTSILDPRAHTHAGYQPIMPPYEGRVTEEELSALVEYIRSLEG